MPLGACSTLADRNFAQQSIANIKRLAPYIPPTMLRSRAVQRAFIRGVANPGIQKPEFQKTTQTSYKKPSDGSAASINNGTSDQPLFPKGTVKPTAQKTLPNIVGALALAVGIMWLWPRLVSTGSDIVDKVPNREDTAAVKVDPLTNKTTVDIPQTYAKLDKQDDDE